VIRLVTQILGRLPVGLLQLLHNPARLLAAVAGVAFANVLVFVQLGLSGSLAEAVSRPYRLFDADLLLVSAIDSDGLDDGSNVPRARLYQVLAHPDVVDGTGMYFGRAAWLTEGLSGRIRGSEGASRVLARARGMKSVRDVGRAIGETRRRVRTVGGERPRWRSARPTSMESEQVHLGASAARMRLPHRHLRRGRRRDAAQDFAQPRAEVQGVRLWPRAA
jgi:hypothetical protein